MRILVIVSVLAMALWNRFTTPSTPPPTPTPAPITAWQDYGANSVAVNADGSFDFPQAPQLVGYVYESPPASLAGKTITLDFTITGTAGVQFLPSSVSANQPADIPPGTIHLFIWEKGDNLSGSGQYEFFRWWAPASKANLALGETKISAVVSPDQWTDVFGKSGTANVAGFNQAINNAQGIGFTFGGQDFYGHGVYVSGGSASFKLNSFTAQ